ncbi:MAG: uroporphyrinogen synthase [Burkholderiaceae bacterium]|nr:uroporphyrinogen synthase [Burkholderiaceae bacterium]
MTERIVITRPQAQAELLARKVSALGLEAVVFPLLVISELPDQAALRAVLADLQPFSLVAFVGPNAIDAALTHLEVWPAGVPIAIMGDGSRLALARHGITEANATIYRPHTPERADSESLLAALDLPALRGKKALIIRGETGRELLADALRAAGVAVSQVAAYRRTAPMLDQALRLRLLELLASDSVWVVTSSEALRNLQQMTSDLVGDAAVANLQQQRLIVSHMRIAEKAQTLGFANVVCAGSSDEHLLAAIQSSL